MGLVVRMRDTVAQIGKSRLCKLGRLAEEMGVRSAKAKELPFRDDASTDDDQCKNNKVLHLDGRVPVQVRFWVNHCLRYKIFLSVSINSARMIYAVNDFRFANVF